MAEKVVIGDCELWHGDAREVLPLLAPVDLVLTDPPYGIGADTHQGKVENGWKQYGPGGWDKDRPSPWLFGLMREKAKECVVWVAGLIAVGVGGGALLGAAALGWVVYQVVIWIGGVL